MWVPRGSRAPETLVPNYDSHCADVSHRFSHSSLVWTIKKKLLMKQVKSSSVSYSYWRSCTATTSTITEALMLHSFCVVNPFVAAAVWHCETHITAQRLSPLGRPVVSGPMDCVSLRSCWGTDQSACRHQHPFINTLLPRARGSVGFGEGTDTIHKSLENPAFGYVTTMSTTGGCFPGRPDSSEFE